MNRHLALLLSLSLVVPHPLLAAEIVAPLAAPVPSAPVVPVGPRTGPLDFSLTPTQAIDQYHAAQTDYLAAIAAVVAIPAERKTFANTVKAFEEAGAVYADKTIRLQFLNQVSPDADMRTVSDMIEEEDGKFNVALGQRQDIYDAIKAYADKGEKLDEQDGRLLGLTIRGFRRAGAMLAGDPRERLKKLQERMVELQKAFKKNVNGESRSLEVTLDDLKGMPEDYVQSVKTEDGKYVITTQYPHVLPLMAYSPNAALREKVHKLFNNRAAPQNLPIIEETLKNRRETAQLLGYKNFPEMALDGRMAGTPENVLKFLNDLWPMLRRKGEAELAELLLLKKKDDPAADKLNAWDTKYYAEKLRQQRFRVDQEEISKYFPVDTVVAGTMRSYERILGVKFTEVKDPEVWQQDVRLFRVEEPADGKLIGYFYLDLYPRPNKYTHAAAFPLVLGRDLGDGKYNPPVSAMVANFTKPVPGQPTLLKPDEVTTFFHEFGHIMHGVLTKARYMSFAGTSVARDFVEGPSQMFENFVWDRGVLDEISGRYDDESKKLPEGLRLKIVAANRQFEDSGLPTAVHFLRQVSFALGDMVIHEAVPASLNELWNQLLSLISLQPTPPGTSMISSFGHLMGGYAAGYYGYLWSLVFADDMFSRFAKEGVFSKVGLDYRREVLEQGSGRPEMDSLRKFLGREPNSFAFFERFKQPAVAISGALSADAVEGLRRAGIADPLTGVDDPRVKDPKQLEAAGWIVEGAPEAGVVHYHRIADDGAQKLTLDIFGAQDFAILETAWRQDGLLREERVSRVGSELSSSSSRRSDPRRAQARALAPEVPPAKPAALWGIVEHKKGSPDVAAQSDAVISAHDWSTGWLWWKRKFTTYMVSVSPEERAKFDAAGFKPIKQLNIVMKWTHVADTNGWGTGVNGTIRGSFTQDLQFPVDKLEDAFEVLEAFQKDPLAVLDRYPENERWLRGLGTAWDRGYLISSVIEVRTGDKAAKTEKVLFSDWSRSGYFGRL